MAAADRAVYDAKAAGRNTEPVVCVPSAMGVIFAATAAPDPALDQALGATCS